jgi:hypothetical protein
MATSLALVLLAGILISAANVHATVDRHGRRFLEVCLPLVTVSVFPQVLCARSVIAGGLSLLVLRGGMTRLRAVRAVRKLLWSA